MIRIGIVGSDNSHALAFAQLCNVEQVFPDARVTCLYGTDPQRNIEVATRGRIDRIVNAPEEMIGNVDAVMVVFRHGDLHAPHAVPFLEAGIPTFVDKPLAIKMADVEAILEAAARRGTPLTSYSTLRYTATVREVQANRARLGELTVGVVTGPCDWQSVYGGPFFYATHTVETMLALFGHRVARVRATSHGGNVAATVEYEGGALVTLHLLGRAKGSFHIAVFGTEGHVVAPVDMSTCYRNGLAVFLEMVRTGRPPLTPDEMRDPIRITHAMVRSLADGEAWVEPAAVG